MPYTIINGDLLDANTEYIVQQNCCTAIRAHGLSEIISKKWPEINPYKDRKKYKGNWAINEDRPETGSILVYEFETPESTGLKGVICAFGQYCHGKPGVYKDPLGLDIHDTYKDREKYFQSCLEAIATLSPKSIGFPYKIGCNLAGGCWDTYENNIKMWSDKYSHINITIYKLN